MMELVDLTLGERLLLSRRRAGITTSAMGAELAVHRNSIANYEHDRFAPKRAALVRWAELTGVSVEWLTGEGPPP
jgi:transcriptional regulator with XRE-family HTH domain